MENNVQYLEQKLKDKKLSPEERAFTLSRLGWLYRGHNDTLSSKYSEEGYELSKKINYIDGIGFGKLNQAFIQFYRNSDIAVSLEITHEALHIFRQTNNEIGFGQSYTVLGMIYGLIDDYDDAFKFINKAIKYHQKTDFDEGLAWSYYIIGNFYLDLKDLDNSYEKLIKAQKIFEKNKEYAGIIACMGSLGSILVEKKDFELALVTHQRSLELACEHDLTNFEARALNDIGVVYDFLNQYAKSIDYLMRGLVLREKNKNRQGITTSQLNLGQVLTKMKDYDDAMEFLKLAEKNACEIGARKKQMKAHKLQANLYKKQKKPWKALEQYEKYLDVKTKIMGEENTAQLKNIQSIHFVEKANQEAEIERLKNTELKKAYEQIALQTTKIIDSIKYAKRIQESVLTPISAIKPHFRDSFIFYKPKDIVSGDFYWFANKGDRLILAAVDCTGHGVPGAFMVVLANALLNEIVNERHIICPGEILTILDKKVRQALHQNQENGSSSQDGMDLALISFDKTLSQVAFAGAKNPLYRVRNDQIERIRGSKFPVGGMLMRKTKKRVYDAHIIQGEKQDMYYIASDGFADQFGGAENRKYLSGRFRRFLLDISDETGEKQKLALENELQVWKGKTKQTDDILVVGIRI